MNGSDIRRYLLASTTLTVTLTANFAQATPLPGLSNLDFSNYTGSAPKSYFTSVNPTGWTGGNGLVFIAGTSAGNNATNGPNSTWQAPSVIASLGNYNYVQADGNPYYESGFSYASVMGLTPGDTYSLTFYQAASQQTGYSGATTNQWIVALGAVGSFLYSAEASSPGTPNSSCGTTCVYVDSDPNASIAASALMNVPSEGLVDWQQTSVELTAHATTETLSFLAWGDNGNTTNLPPMAFLTGVNSFAPPTGVPEPATWAMVGLGFAGLGMIGRRRRRPATAG